MPAWPAILKHEGLEELFFLAGEAQWRRESGEADFRYTQDDMLIDSRGRVYRLVPGDAGPAPTLQDSGRRLSPRQLSDMVRGHISATGQCCVSKLEFSDYPACFAMVQQTAGQ
jgi:hypothetical protein